MISLTESRRRKPNILQLIYKFLVDNAERAQTKCHSQENACHDGVVDSADTSRIAGRSMGHRVRKDEGRISKTRGIRRPTSRDLPISYLQKCVGGEGTKLIRSSNYQLLARTRGLGWVYLIIDIEYTLCELIRKLCIIMSIMR